MTQNELAAQIETLVAAADIELSAFDVVLELAEPVVSPSYSPAEGAVIDEVQRLAEGVTGHPMWPEEYSPILDAIEARS